MLEEKQEQTVQENSTVAKTRKRRPYNRKPKTQRANMENEKMQEDNIFKKLLQ